MADPPLDPAVQEISMLVATFVVVGAAIVAGMLEAVTVNSFEKDPYPYKFLALILNL